MKDKVLDFDEDVRNPQYVPRKGFFFEHDDRTLADKKYVLLMMKFLFSFFYNQTDMLLTSKNSLNVLSITLF